MIKTDNISYLNSEYDKNKRRKIVFMDRDGTIHVDKVETHLIDDLEFFPDTVNYTLPKGSVLTCFYWY